MADLQFVDYQDASAHIAVGMYSKEKEYVPFQAECDCIGHVRFDYEALCVRVISKG
jgi:dynein heavy chain